MRLAGRLLPLVAGLQFSRLPLRALGAHYTCGGDEVVGEVQGETGVVCGPRCREGSFDCATDVPDGTIAQPQCILQDVDQQAYCGLLCQSDSQCPSGDSCRRPGNSDVSICIRPLSFSEWAKQTSRKKLAVGWPSRAGQSTRGFQIAKAYAALQSLKRRYGIADGDADVLVVKELLSATSARSVGSVAAGAPSLGASVSAPGPAPVASVAAKPQPQPAQVQYNRPSGDVLGAWKHDIGYFAQNVKDGLPGLQREVHDTVWNVEHLTSRGVASELLRGIILFALVYVGGGCAYKYQAMGARGLEMVPHVGFWMEYPQLVADGIKYSMMLVGDLMGQTSARGGGFSSGGSSDRDTFAHFEPSK